MPDHRLKLIDCTLRDGEQAAGVFFTLAEKLAITHLLDAAGIDIVDAGMPSVSKEEQRTIEALLATSRRATVAATVRALRSDIDLAIDCGLKEVFLFMSVSPQHLRHKFGITLAEASRRIEGSVGHAVDSGLRVHFVAEDSVRAHPAELAPIFDSVAGLGAVSVVICDTVGVMQPAGIQRFIKMLIDRMTSNVPLGIHCHNDYGLATANTLSAFDAGCDLITGTVNGLGERAGNAALEEVICALLDLYKVSLKIDLPVLQLLSETVATASGIFVTPTKPIVGLNVFRHESGIHVDGMLADPSTYESVDPGRLGRQHEYLLGKHAGRALVQALLQDKGIIVPTETIARILDRVKQHKASKDKSAFVGMAASLKQFWSEHLSFDETEFWRIVEDELLCQELHAGMLPLPIAAQH